jgi:hypothetical protein
MFKLKSNIYFTKIYNLEPLYKEKVKAANSTGRFSQLERALPVDCGWTLEIDELPHPQPQAGWGSS